MNKDVIVASCIGFGLGLIAAILLWIVPRVLPKLSPQKPHASVVASPQTEGSLEITSPKDGEIIKNDTVRVEGKSAIGTKLVILSTASGEYPTSPKEDGTFSAEIKLTEGATEIMVTTFDENKHTETKTITVFYTTEGI